MVVNGYETVYCKERFLSISIERQDLKWDKLVIKLKLLFYILIALTCIISDNCSKFCFDRYCFLLTET